MKKNGIKTKRLIVSGIVLGSLTLAYYNMQAYFTDLLESRVNSLDRALRHVRKLEEMNAYLELQLESWSKTESQRNQPIIIKDPEMELELSQRRRNGKFRLIFI